MRGRRILLVVVAIDGGLGAIGLLVLGSGPRRGRRGGIGSHGRSSLHVIRHLRRHGGRAFGRRSHGLREHRLRTALGSTRPAEDVVVGGLTLLRRRAALGWRILGHCERRGLASTPHSNAASGLPTCGATFGVDSCLAMQAQPPGQTVKRNSTLDSLLCGPVERLGSRESWQVMGAGSGSEG